MVAITGSVGKTTTKELVVAALRRRGRVMATRGSANAPWVLALRVLHARPWHRFLVIEVASGEHGAVADATRLLEPDVAVVLSVARTHTHTLGSLDEIAAEKASLLDGLRPGGAAILNDDDPRVAAMAPPRHARTVRFGSASHCDVRVRDASSRWPARLSLDLEVGGVDLRCDTRLVGTHWQTSVAAAMAVAWACGVPPEDAAAAISEVAPTLARLSPVRLPSGAVLLRDAFNGSVDTLQAALAALREAQGVRRCLVISDYTDLGESFRGRFRLLPSLVEGAVDAVVLVGEHAAYGQRRLLEAGFEEAAITVADGLEHAAAMIRDDFGPGDLVLMRGRSTDHLSRLAVAQFGEIACWKSHCTILTLCDECRLLGADRATLRAAAKGADDGATPGPGDLPATPR